MAATVLIHALQGLIQCRRFLDGGQIGGHDLAYRRQFRVAALDDDAHHQVTLAKQATKLVVFKDQYRADAQFGHAPSDIGHGLIISDGKQVPAAKNFLDSDHRCPPQKPPVK